MWPRLLLVCVTLPALFGFAPAPPPRLQRPQDLLARMQGSWVITDREGRWGNSEGNASPQTRIRIRGTTWTVDYGNPPAGGNRGTIDYRIVLTAQQGITTMDLFLANRPVPWMKGIIRLRGDRLEWCYLIGEGIADRPRPDGFEPVAPQQLLMNLRRDPSTKGNQP